MTDFKKLEKLFKAIANKRRLMILAFLKKEGEASVGVIARHLDISFKATSKHIGILYSAGLIDRQQKGLEMYYWVVVKRHPITELLYTLF